MTPNQPKRPGATAPAAALPFDPMRGTVMAGAGGGSVPPDNYEATFTGAEYLPATEGDPMTGKGGRQWPAVKFTWKLDDDRTTSRETPANYGAKSGYTATVGWLLGRTPAVGESYDLAACVGKRYLITVGPKLNKAGQPTGWTEVTACIPLPTKKQ